jgi:2-iminobutanoate/2-iminopropanoate deaminase
MKESVNTPDAPSPIGPYSQAISHQSLLFISGQICIEAASGQLKNRDIREETMQVMQNLKAILAKAGLDFSHVLKTTIFLTDMNQFSEVNEVYGKFFQEPFPARETVAVSALPKFVNVEISMIAGRS